MKQGWGKKVEEEYKLSEQKLRKAADEYCQLNMKWEEEIAKGKENFT